jgi:hypothetical protein
MLIRWWMPPDALRDRLREVFGGRRLAALLGCVWVAVGLCGCAPRPAFFPLGIYGVPKEDLPLAKAAGFNTVYAKATKDYLDAARQAELRVLATAGSSAGKGFNHAGVRSAVERLDAHPALWSWYLIDEPDLHNVSPGEVVAARRHFRRFGARKPTSLVVFDGGSAADYGSIPDWMMVDRYPVPWAPLWTFWDHVRLARLGTPRRTPLVPVLQGFSWEHYPELLGPAYPGPFRPPTRLEMENMAHQAMVVGVDGLFFYAWKARGWDATSEPGFHGALTNVLSMVQERLPLFQAEKEWWPYWARFNPADTARDQTVGAPVKSAWLRVRVGTRRVPAGHYWVGVNVMEEPVTMEFKLPAFTLSDRLTSLDGKSYPVETQWVGLSFGALETIILGPFGGE